MPGQRLVSLIFCQDTKTFLRSELRPAQRLPQLGPLRYSLYPSCVGDIRKYAEDVTAGTAVCGACNLFETSVQLSTNRT